MKLWTIQTPDVWNRLQATGIWRACERFLSEDWRDAYRWIIGQMEVRLGPRVLHDQAPVWVWRQWDGTRRPKPDLRSRGHLPVGTRGVRIELELDDVRVLLSDFELWHYALNYWYLPSSVRDGREFDAELRAASLSYYRTKPLPDIERHMRIERSWEKIFDLRWANRAYTAKQEEKTIQGVVWEIRRDDVRDVVEFVAR